MYQRHSDSERDSVVAEPKDADGSREMIEPYRLGDGEEPVDDTATNRRNERRVVHVRPSALERIAEQMFAAEFGWHAPAGSRPLGEVRRMGVWGGEVSCRVRGWGRGPPLRFPCSETQIRSALATIMYPGCGNAECRRVLKVHLLLVVFIVFAVAVEDQGGAPNCRALEIQRLHDDIGIATPPLLQTAGPRVSALIARRAVMRLRGRVPQQRTLSSIASRTSLGSEARAVALMRGQAIWAKLPHA